MQAINRFSRDIDSRIEIRTLYLSPKMSLSIVFGTPITFKPIAESIPAVFLCPVAADTDEAIPSRVLHNSA